MDEREAAWWRLHHALEARPGWHVIVHHAAVRGHRARREAVEGTGAMEIAAPDELVHALVRAGAGPT